VTLNDVPFKNDYKNEQEVGDSNRVLREPDETYSLMHIQPLLLFYLRKQNSEITEVRYKRIKFDLCMEIIRNRRCGQGTPQTGVQSDTGARQIVVHNHLLCLRNTQILYAYTPLFTARSVTYTHKSL
jgi:hypothetical protein